MSYDTPDAYHQPEEFGLEIVGAIEWSDGDYQFDTTVVWRDPLTGLLFYAEDSGCSCPSPFEDFTSREKLTGLLGVQQFVDHTNKRLEGYGPDSYQEKELPRVTGQVGELVLKMRAFLPPHRTDSDND